MSPLGEAVEALDHRVVVAVALEPIDAPIERPPVSRRLGDVSLGLVGRDGLTVAGGFELGWWDAAEVVEELPVVEPVDPVASSRSSRPRQGPLLRASSVLWSPMIDSASALSSLSPPEPTEATTPHSARRSVQRRARRSRTVGSGQRQSSAGPGVVGADLGQGVSAAGAVRCVVGSDRPTSPTAGSDASSVELRVEGSSVPPGRAATERARGLPCGDGLFRQPIRRSSCRRLGAGGCLPLRVDVHRRPR